MNAMSLDQSWSFHDENPGVEYQAVAYKSIPWTREGKGTLTVKLTLWWLHMLASAPGIDTSVQDNYPPLDSWVMKEGKYHHTSTGMTYKEPRSGATVN